MKNYKIIIIGPPNTGKTTIKKVFFEMANPVKLLETSLHPTIGADTGTYTFFNSKIGIFDLAGQENRNWLSKEKDIFNHCNIIICVFDVRDSLKSIITFLFRILNITKKINLQDCEIFGLLHKIDLVKPSYVSNKKRAIKTFFKIKFPKPININLYSTSITSMFFFRTYNIILNILTQITQKDLIHIDKKEFDNLSIELAIILKYNNYTFHSKDELSQKFKFSLDEADIHLKRLENLGFVEIKKDDINYFHLTDRSLYLKSSLEREEDKIEGIRANQSIELFHVFLNLSKVSQY